MRLFLHNLLAHPLMAVLHLVGLVRLGNWVHEVTAPPLTLTPDLSQADIVTAVLEDLAAPESDPEFAAALRDYADKLGPHPLLNEGPRMHPNPEQPIGDWIADHKEK